MVARIVLAADVVATAGQCVAAALPAGDPARVRLATRRSAALSDALMRSSAVLRQTAGSPVWRGQAHSAFVETMSHSAPRLDATANRYRAYTTALASYSADLDNALRVLPWLAREISWRRDELVQLRMAPAPVHPDPTLRRRVDTAEADLWPLVRRFIDAHSTWADAVDRCSAALLRANANDPTHDLHGWRAFGHEVSGLARWAEPIWELATDPSLKHLSEACETLASALSFAGIALSFVFPPAAGVCFTAATVLAAAKLATDVARLANGEDVSAGTFVLDALQVGGVHLAGKGAGKVAGRFVARSDKAFVSEAEAEIRDLPDGLVDTHGIQGDGFVLGGAGTLPKKVRWNPHAQDPKWGLTDMHMKKHFWGLPDAPEYALVNIDPGGTAERWLSQLQSLLGGPEARVFDNGVVEYRGRFARTDGNGSYRLGIRVHPNDRGTLDLVTILTGQ